MIYGVQAAKDIKISNVASSLQEDIKLIKTEERLCRNLAAEDFSDHINEHIIRLGDDKITDDMVLAIDPGDIMKPYAKSMENLCGIYDGSQHREATGYHLCQVTAANLEHNYRACHRLLYQHLYGPESKAKTDGSKSAYLIQTLFWNPYFLSLCNGRWYF
jgi:hypothetical protein